MSTNPIARDLGRKMQVEINQSLGRNLDIAQHVLEPAELSILLIEVAVSVSLSAASTAAASANDQAGLGEVFDFTLDMIATMARGDRERALAVATARRSEARS